MIKNGYIHCDVKFIKKSPSIRVGEKYCVIVAERPGKEQEGEITITCKCGEDRFRCVFVFTVIDRVYGVNDRTCKMHAILQRIGDQYELVSPIR